jgi:hypothetical protein
MGAHAVAGNAAGGVGHNQHTVARRFTFAAEAAAAGCTVAIPCWFKYEEFARVPLARHARQNILGVATAKDLEGILALRRNGGAIDLAICGGVAQFEIVRTFRCVSVSGTSGFVAPALAVKTLATRRNFVALVLLPITRRS